MEKIRFQIHEKEHKLYPAVGEESTMSEERYAIIFSSLTGNTRKLADTIHETLPTALCDFFGEAKSAETTQNWSMWASGRIRERRIRRA